MRIFVLLFVFITIGFCSPNVSSLISTQLDFVLKIATSVLGSIVSIFLIPFAWYKVSEILFRESNTINSTASSREKARKRLLKSKNKSSQYIGNGEARKSSSFRKKFNTYEDFEGSRDSLINKKIVSKR